MIRLNAADYRLVPGNAAIPVTAEDDPRCGKFISRGLNGRVGKGDIVLIGFCCDEGVRRNRGRPGSAGAPDRIRELFYRLTPDPIFHQAFEQLLKRTHDAGNIQAGKDMEAAQERLGRLAADLLKAGACPVILGGGHETTYGHFLGYVFAGKRVAILNIDAHPDVRPFADGRGHSGSVFRQALEHESGLCTEYRVAGLQPQSVAKAHLDYLGSRNVRYTFADAVNRQDLEKLWGDTQTSILMTMDMDAVGSSYAPGVSAPSSTGMDPGIWLHIAFSAGRTRNVKSFDLVEVNPLHDVDERTLRLAALTVWNFIRGRASTV